MNMELAFWGATLVFLALSAFPSLRTLSQYDFFLIGWLLLTLGWLWRFLNRRGQ